MQELKQFWNASVERCGFILKSGEIVEVENISEAPEMEFEVSEEDLEKYYSEISATWHSHINSFSNLSLSDYHTFLGFPEFDHWIVSQYKTVRFYVENNAVFIGEVLPYEES